ncbi:MAG: TIGR03088 family PEP-CTERM/XrtA system glycosyltransferase [Magnetococcales bacterium]|nr:TIGR03088 family PEP-CTERM/XrtA system glycosyltransferase [Magnetococcales bacterium]
MNRHRIAHLVYRFDIGGLESVVARLIDHLPHDRFDHAVISLTEITDFRHRIHHPRVAFHALHKREGQDPAVWWRLWKFLRSWRPDLVHACNLATLEGAVPTRLAGVKRFVHAEHGRDTHDPDGTNRKYLLLRRLLTPWVDRFVPVSRDLAQWMETTVHIPAAKIHPILNGVALPAPGPARPAPDPARPFLIGTVGRLWPIKDHVNLIHAFHALRQRLPDRAMQLMIVGDGPERTRVETLAARLDLTDALRITGWQNDITPFLQQFDLFVLPSKAEGTPLTILEAMAMALPVVATRVGGVPDLVVAGATGQLVPPEDPQALADAMLDYLLHPARLNAHGTAGRARIATDFSMTHMVAHYQTLFESLLVTKNQAS